MFSVASDAVRFTKLFIKKFHRHDVYSQWKMISEYPSRPVMIRSKRIEWLYITTTDASCQNLALEFRSVFTQVAK